MMKLRDYGLYTASVFRLGVIDTHTDQGQMGTAFVLEFGGGYDKMYAAVTNRHIANAGNKFTAYMRLRPVDGTKTKICPITIVANENFVIYHPNDKADLAIFPLAPFCQRALEEFGEKICFYPIKLTDVVKYDSPSIGIEEVVMCGYPGGFHEPVFLRGITSTPVGIKIDDAQIFYCDMNGCSGMSGSPVFKIDAEKPEAELLGVHFGSATPSALINSNGSSRDFHLSACITAAELYRVLDMIPETQRYRLSF